MNLAEVEANGRVTRQRRITNNRDGILPGRRNTNAPELAVVADLRDARRGDGAREVAAALGILDTASSIIVDKVNYNDARAREMAVAKARVAAKGAGESAGLEMEKWINEARDVNGDGVFTEADLQGLVDQYFQQAALDEEGRPLDFGHPEAHRAMALDLLEARQSIMLRGRKFLADKEEADHLNNAAVLLTDDAAKTGAYDIAGAIDRLPAGFDRTVAKKAFLTAALDDADANGNVKAFDSLLATTKSDGTELWTPAERAAIRDKQEATEARVERESERAQKERHEAATEGFIERMVQGQPLSITEIREAERADSIPAQTALTLITRIKNEQEASENKALRAALSAANESKAASVVAMASEWRAGLGPTSYEDASKVLLPMLRNGSITPSQFNQLQASARAGRAEVGKNPSYRIYAQEIGRHFKPAGGGGSTVASALGKSKAYDVAGLAAAMETYTTLTLDQKVPPAEAFEQVRKKHLITREQRIAELKAKQGK